MFSVSEFDIQIGLVRSGHFSGTLEVVILGKFQRFPFDLRLKSIQDMVKDLADRIFPGISGRSKRQVEERMKRAFPDFSKKQHFPAIYRPGSHEANEPRTLQETTPEQTNDTESREIAKTHYMPYQPVTTHGMDKAIMDKYEASVEAYKAEDLTGITVERLEEEVGHFEDARRQYPKDEASSSEPDVSALDVPSLADLSDTGQT